MKKIYICLVLCFYSLLPLKAEEKQSLTEESQINLLIEATKSSLQSLQELQNRLKAFREQEAICIQKPDNADALFTLSECALALSTSIRENKLEPYFRSSFIEELDTLKKMAQSKNLPPIQTP